MIKAYEIETSDAGSRFEILGYLYIRLKDCERTHFTESTDFENNIIRSKNQ